MVWLLKWSALSAGQLCCGSICCFLCVWVPGRQKPEAWCEVILTAIPKKTDKVGLQSMRYISLLPVLQKFYIRALQTAVKRERKPHETNILGYELGRSTAGITATLRQFLGKATEGASELLLHLRMWKVPLTALDTWTLSVPCCKKGFILHLSVPCPENLVISRVELIDQVHQCRLPFRMLEVPSKEVLKDLTCGIKFWTKRSENQLLVGNLRRMVSNWQPTIAGSGRRVAILFPEKT